MASHDDRLEMLERQQAALGKDLAVHLSECMGMHKAIDLKLTGVESGVTELGQKLSGHIMQTESNLKRLERLIILVGLVLLLASFAGGQDTIKVLISLVK